MKQIIWITMAAIAGPLIATAILAALFYSDSSSRVVEDFKVTRVVVNKDTESLYGTFDKVRACTFKTVVGVDMKGNLYGIDFSHDSVVTSRPLGFQKFGPWTIKIQPGTPLRLMTFYRCHALWDHQEELGFFENKNEVQ